MKGVVPVVAVYVIYSSTIMGRHTMRRPSPAGRGRERVETGGFSASAHAAPVEPLTSVHRRRTILRGAGRHEHPPLEDGAG